MKSKVFFLIAVLLGVMFYGAGGMHIQDIDSYILDETGETLDEDDDSDKIPKMKVKLDEAAVIQLGITPFSYFEDYESDYVCFIACADGEGAIMDFEGEVAEAVEPPAIRNIGDITLDEVYREQMQLIIDEFLGYREFEEDSVQSGVVLVDPETYFYEESLESGIYNVYAMTDSRASDYTLSVLNEDGESIAVGPLRWRYASNPFGIMEASNIRISLDITFRDETDAEEAYAAFFIDPVCGVDNESRWDYVVESLEDSVGWSEESGDYEVVDSGTGTILNDGTVEVLEYDLDEGLYFFDGYGGPAIRDIAMVVTDSSGTVLFRDDRDLSAAFGYMEIEEPMMVRVEISAIEFLLDFEEEYFYYLLMKSLNWQG